MTNCTPIILAFWEEMVGPLGRISTSHNGRAVVEIGKHALSVPDDILADLYPHVGERIAIIRCGGERSYRVRVELR